MKKTILALSLVLNVILLVEIASRAERVHAAPEAAPAGNGDVNGDGEYNLTDAVYLLNWLFIDGPSPLPAACDPPAAAGALPATGQKECYDLNGAPVDCDDAPCPGQDGAYQAGCPSEDRFTDNGDGTVTDACTGLMWQRATADHDGDGMVGPGDFVPRCGAMLYCEELRLAGHDDWRLPNIRELLSLAEYGRSFPAIDPVFEVALENPCYYTSTALLGGPGPGYFGVDFGLGGIVGGGGILCYTRAVRNASPR